MITTIEGVIATGEMVIIVVTVTETTAREIVVLIGRMRGNMILAVLEPDPRMTTRNY